MHSDALDVRPTRARLWLARIHHGLEGGREVIAFCWQLMVLVLLLAVLTSIPILQFATLGYLLNGAVNLAAGMPWASGLPNLKLAGKIGTYLLIAGLFWIPVWMVSNLAYSAQILVPGTPQALRWRFGALLLAGVWLLYIVWVAMRGGNWWQFFWPAPLRFCKEFFQRKTWADSSDRLYGMVCELRLGHYWWLGTRATLGALIWITIPALLMALALRSEQVRAPGLLGLGGAFGMVLVVLYLPFTQIQFAMTDRFRELFNVKAVRDRFRYAPGLHALAMLVLSTLTIPLYLVRIEATPSQLLWLPSLIFIVFLLPIKLLFGGAMAYASKRQRLNQSKRSRFICWLARIACVASCLNYVGTLYIAQLVAGQGILILFFQHAFLVPPPLMSP